MIYPCGHEGTSRCCPRGCQVQPILPAMDARARERFALRMVRAAPDACWPWLGRGKRYGVFRAGGAVVRAHRVAWALAHDEEPGVEVVRHLCHNTRCVNPAHLVLGSQKENMRDRYEREREGKHVNEEGLARIAAYTGLPEELLRRVALGTEARASSRGRRG